MPANVQWLPKPEILTFEEIEYLVRLFASEGVDQLRLTGGEPLVRRDLHVLIERLLKIPGISDLSLTTNGHFLKDQAERLRNAGMKRINISLDSLHADRFAKITRSNSFDKVMEGIAAAKAAGFDPIKINCVAIRGFNDDEIVDFLKWGAKNQLKIRFIEFMPLDGDHNWKLPSVLSKAEILEKARQFANFSEVFDEEPAPAARYSTNEGKSDFGIIPSVTEPFCANCSRIRITAEGKFRNCLFAIDETDLRDPLRSGATSGELRALVRKAIFSKWAGHKINHPDFEQPRRAMYAIGG
jgi:cyclic pyranopterin phosphate synthase